MSTPEATLRQAVALHQAGDQRGAERLYREVLTADPNCADAHHLLGMIALAEGRPATAIECIQSAIASNPSVPQFFEHLGAARGNAGDREGAVDAYRRRAELEPLSAAAHHDLAAALGNAGRPVEAEASYRRALAIHPQMAEAHNNLGDLLHHQNRLPEAFLSLQEAVRLRPDRAQIHCNLGNCLRDQQRFDEAATAFRRALALQPDFTLAWRSLAAVLIALGEFAEAAESYRAVLRVDPSDVDATIGLGVALQSLGRLEEARACYDRVLAIEPDNVTAHFNRGSLLQTKRRLVDAEAEFETCVRLLPDSVDLWLHLGKCRQVQGKADAAIACYRRAIAIDPEFKHAHYFLGLLLLAQGHFAAGWREHEWRLKDSGREFPMPKWDGSDLDRRRILVHAEWGLGDTLMFVRYVPLVEARGGSVVLEAQPALVPLLKQSGFEHVIAAGEPLPPCDVHVPLLSLPGIFGTTFESIPASVSYVAADPELSAFWRDKLRRWPGFRVAIQWLGSPIAGGEARFIPLSAFEAVARIPGVTLINLQKHQGAAEVAALGDRFEIVDLDDDVSEAHRPFVATAAILKNLDLVITSDTSIAHLAGALGVPTWVALPYAADWRWFRDREDSPWYPTLRLFRQRAQDDWSELFERIAAGLSQQVAAGKR